MLLLKSSTGDSITIELPDDLDIDAETAAKLADGDIEIEADDLVRIMRAQMLDNLL